MSKNKGYDIDLDNKAHRHLTEFAIRPNNIVPFYLSVNIEANTCKKIQLAFMDIKSVNQFYFTKYSLTNLFGQIFARNFCFLATFEKNFRRT